MLAVPGSDKHKLWVCELHKEARHILEETKLGLSRPAIYLHESAQIWGRWDPLNLSISISQTVVETCPWRVVVQILKHEIAHQVTDHLYGEDTAPHGQNFQRVCKGLGMEEWARRAASGKSLSELQALADWKQAPVDARVARYQRRLEKLQALANSENEHEAMLAMQRAQELQDQHRISVLETDQNDDFVSVEIGSGKQRHQAYEGRIASILMSHFHVDIVFATRFCAGTCRPEAVVDVLGRREDVLVAEYVHAFLHQSANTLWLAHRKEQGSKGLRARNSYVRGLLAGFDARLTQERQGPDSAKMKPQLALVRADEALRARFVRQRYPRLSSRKSSGRIDRGAYNTGHSEGGKLSLRRPVSSGASERPRLLPSG